MKKKWKAVLASMGLLGLVLGFGLACDGGGGSAPNIENIPPTVTFVSPLPNATDVPLNSSVTASFSEAMNPDTINTETFTLTYVDPVEGITPVSGTVGYTDVTATFTPDEDLDTFTTYTATITTGVHDLVCNTLEENFVWTFTTGDVPDTTNPTVSSTIPENLATGVVLSIKPTATFSEAMDPDTINTTTFTLTGPGLTPVSGTVVYTDVKATFTPDEDLEPSTEYTATITTGAEDLAGNPLLSNYFWTFTTGVVPDTTSPTLISTIPEDAETGVALNIKPTATFSETMDPLTINTTTFTLTGPGLTPVSGTVVLIGNTATFTPLDNLEPNTEYTATITTGAEDLAGNPLVPGLVPNPWVFTTGAAPDTIEPEIDLTNPADSDIDVELNTAINATFSEAMDPLTINTETFTVQKSVDYPLGPILQGAVTYDVLTNIATFTPLDNLEPSTQYTAFVTTGAEDLAGNPLVPGLVPNPWIFTTGTGLAPGAVSLGAASTFGIAASSAITNIPTSTINGNVALTPGTSCDLLPAEVNGTIHINDQAAFDVYTDLLTAYNFAKALPSDATVPPGTNLGAWAPTGSVLPPGTLPPGVYTSGSTMSIETLLTLDAGGNANAVWVFQIGSSLTTTNPLGSVNLINGAQAKNVFWVPTEDATIGSYTIFQGTLLAGRDATGQTDAVINGRILAGAIGAGTIALDRNTVNVPAP